MMIALTVICVAACAALVFGEWRALVGLRIVAKLTASAAFVALGALLFQHSHADPGLGVAIVVGLVLGAIGDACLLASSKRWFLAGLVAFLFGHIAYVVGFAAIEPVARWRTDASWCALIPIAVGAAALARLWPRLGSMRIPVIGYVLVITTMVVAAMAVAHGATLPATNRHRLLAGACLFFVSDLSVARNRFVAKSFANKAWGLPAYYAGQLLIAWTLDGL